MGVVYKLRKEVIDFVLQQKRTDHDLGCRQLATLASEKFKIQVSKSSVNAIIKNANLSNSVGRPISAELLPKKFQIPPQKKQQLLDEVRKTKLEQKPLPPKVLAPPSKGHLLDRPRLDPAAETQDKDPSSSLQGVFGRKEPGGQVTFLRHVESLRARRSQVAGVMREGMGCVFLKAAQWQFSRSSALGGLLRKYIPGPLPPRFDAFCDVLPCLALLGISDPRQNGQLANHALWDLGGFDQPPADLEILHWSSAIQGVPSSVKFSLEYEKEKRQALMEARHFEFHLANGSRIMVEASLAGLSEEKFSTGFTACVQQAMAVLSHCVISNNDPAIFLSSGHKPFSGGRARFSQGALDMMAAFEGAQDKQLQKAIVFDVAGERVAEFSVFPRKKRFFMMGVWPWQEEFLLLSKDTKTVEPFYDEVTDKVFYVAAGPARIFPGEPRSKTASLRSVAVLASPQDAPIVVILTNCADEAPSDILQAFLRRWPNLDAGPAGQALSVSVPFPSGISQGVLELAGSPGQDLSWVVRDWAGVLDQYCRRHFFGEKFINFDITQLISTFYSLPGQCVFQEKALLVSLRPPSTYIYSKELQQAIEHINEANVTDPFGRPIFINILK